MGERAHEVGHISKVVIIGAGNVGATAAYTLMTNGTAGEVVLIDVNAERAIGEAMDISHALPFGGPVHIRAGDYPDCQDADLVVITAGVPQKPGETRLDLVRKNTEILKQIIPQVTAYAQDCILLMVANPVDILTYATWKISGFSYQRVFGSGTSLDTARFRYNLGKYFEVNPRSVHAYIIGEHGDTEVPVWSLANIAGMRLVEYCEATGLCHDERDLQVIFDNVRDAAAQIIQRKGATFYAIAAAIDTIARAILNNQHMVITLSSLIDGQYGVSDICLSLPTVLGRSGVERVLELNLNDKEVEGFRKSAETLKRIARELGL